MAMRGNSSRYSYKLGKNRKLKSVGTGVKMKSNPHHDGVGDDIGVGDISLSYRNFNSNTGAVSDPSPILPPDINSDPDINHPQHYNQGSVEVVDALDAWGFGVQHHIASAIEYLARAGHKHLPGETDRQAALKDLGKAVWRIERARKLLLQMEQVEHDEPGGPGKRVEC